jgi:DNA repair protein RecO (recombination protein O)
MRTSRQTLRTEALVLRSVDYSEADRILHLLVPEQGRITVIAKHARKSVKRFAGNLDLFNHLRVQIVTRRTGTIHRLDQARLVKSFEPLRTDPVRFALGCYLLEMLDRLAPEGGNRKDMERLFRFVLEAFEWLSAREPDERVRIFLELRALEALGLRPEFRRCVRCGREPAERDEVDFHVADGGPLCGACAVRQGGLLRLHRGTLRALEQGLSWELSRLDRLVLPPRALEEARLLVGRFQRFHVGVELASERFLREMLSPREAPVRAP